MKITAKLIITIIITSLLTMLVYELAVNGFLHEDKERCTEKIKELERKVDCILVQGGTKWN